MRLLGVCAATALACGFVAVAAAPHMLVGAAPAAPAAPTAAEPVRAGPAADAGTLALSARLRLDPRETQANLIRWSRMTEAERRTLLGRYWQLAALSPADLDRLIEQYAAFRELPESRQLALRTQARKLRQFIQSLSPQDQAILESMNDRDRAERLLDLWQARQKTW